MTVLTGDEIVRYRIVDPWTGRTRHESGLTWGKSYAGYDLRLGRDCAVSNGDGIVPFGLGITMERVQMPRSCIGFIKDKSSLARAGISVMNTVIEPGWEGWVTLEVVSYRRRFVLPAGMPVCQLVVIRLGHGVETGYEGEYMHAPDIPQRSRAQDWLDKLPHAY